MHDLNGLGGSNGALFARYSDLLIEWNQRFNLTAVTAPEGIRVRHFEDSIQLLALGLIPRGAAVADVGTGAGLPGIPLAISDDTLRVTLMESIGKKCTFLSEAVTVLGLSGVAVAHIRAEDACKLPQYRAQYDVATARAVATLDKLCRYALPLLKPGGRLLAMKAPSAMIQDELLAATKYIKDAARVTDVIDYTLSDGAERSVVVIEKKG